MQQIDIEHEAIRVDIPFRPTEERLPNGVQLVSLPMPNESLLRVDICFRGGTSVERIPLQAKFAINQNCGSRKYPPQVVAEKLNFCGTEINAYCTPFHCRMTLVCLPRLLPPLLPVLFSLLDQPTYGRKRLRLAVATAKTDWLIARQKVEKICNERLYSLLFPPSHPMARQVEEAHFDQIKVELLREYQQHFLHAGEVTLFLTGKMEKDTLDLVRRTLGEQAWGGREPLPVSLPPMPSHPFMPREHTDHLSTPTVQSAIRMGFILPPLTHPDIPALRLANTILGGYFGSRLMSNLREDKGYTYHVGSRIMNCPGGSLLVIGTEVGKEVTREALEQMHVEIERLGNELVSEEELDKVKNYLDGRACRQYEAHINFADQLINLRISGRTIDDLLHEHRRLNHTSSEEVRQVVRSYLNPHDAATAIAC